MLIKNESGMREKSARSEQIRNWLRGRPACENEREKERQRDRPSEKESERRREGERGRELVGK